MGKLNKKYFESRCYAQLKTMRYLPRWVIMIIDTIICFFSYLFTYMLSTSMFHGEIAGYYSFWQSCLFVLLVQTVAFGIFRIHSGILRYSGFIDAIKIMGSVLLAMALAVGLNYLSLAFGEDFIFPNATSILYILLAFVGMFFLRLFAKTFFEAISNSSANDLRVVIYGTKNVGIAIAKMLRSTGGGFKFVGFIDDDPEMSGKIVLGHKVNMLDNTLLANLQRLNVQGVIISPRKMAHLDPATDLDIFINNNIKILSVPLPKIEDNDNRKIDFSSINNIKAIEIEDLLERPSIKMDISDVGNQLEGKVVMVTGAVGSIGSELVSQIATFRPRMIVMLDQAESPLHDFLLDIREKFPRQSFSPCIADVRNLRRLETIMETYRPDIIYHAAAYKHVPLMEDNPSEGIQTNIMGTINMANLAVKYHAQKFIMVSTDKAVNPTNIMGATKRIAEIYVQSLYNKLVVSDTDTTQFVTTRFGNVLGSSGSVIPYFKKQIERGGPVTVTHPDIIRYFMTIPEACTLVLEAGLLGNGGEIFIFDMGTPVKILDLAKKMIRLGGYKLGVDIKIEFSGLRPGEKLYEELLNKKEVVLPTDNPKIMRAKVTEYDFDAVKISIDKLIDYSYSGKDFMMVAQMKKIVPEFLSKNSQYERLD